MVDTPAYEALTLTELHDVFTSSADKLTGVYAEMRRSARKAGQSDEAERLMTEILALRDLHESVAPEDRARQLALIQEWRQTRERLLLDLDRRRAT